VGYEGSQLDFFGFSVAVGLGLGVDVAFFI
jgi:hypothetical protein